MKTIKKLLKPFYRIFTNLFKENKYPPLFILLNFSLLYKCVFRQSKIIIKGKNNKLILGDGCVLRGVVINISGNNNYVFIGKNTSFNGNKNKPVTFNVRGNRKLIIGDDCMFSDSISLTTTDFHPIVSTESGKRLNHDADIIIGNHVWFGFDVLVLKGVSIPNNCIVAAKSVITKSIEEEYCTIAGNPAKVVSHKRNWSRV